MNFEPSDMIWSHTTTLTICSALWDSARMALPTPRIFSSTMGTGSHQMTARQRGPNPPSRPRYHAWRPLMLHLITRRSRCRCQALRITGGCIQLPAPCHAGIDSPDSRRVIAVLSTGLRLLSLCLVATLTAAGCGEEEKSHYTSVSKPPTVQLIQPEVRKIVRLVGQPSFIEAFDAPRSIPR